MTLMRVLICDDHSLVRSGVRRLLEHENDVEISGEAANAEEAISRVRENPPDIVVLDILMPGRSGIDALSDIGSACPSTKILMLSTLDDPAYARHALAAGAAGYVLKDNADTELVPALHDVHAGRRYLNPTLEARLTSAESITPIDPDGALTELEHDILCLLALGFTNHEIADDLGLPIRIVETRRTGIAQKLGVRTRAEMIGHANHSAGAPAPVRTS